MLAGHVGDHRCSHLGDHTAITKHVAGTQEDLCRADDQRTNPLNQRVDALHSTSAESFHEAAARKRWARVHDNYRDIIALLMRLYKQPFKNEIDANDHYRVVALLWEKFKTQSYHLVLSKHNLVLNETINLLRNSDLNLAQSDILCITLADRQHESVKLVEGVQHALMQSFAVLDEGNRRGERIL